MGKIIPAKRLRIKIYVDMLFELSDSIFSHLIKNEFLCFETVANVDQSSFVLLSTYPIRKTYVSMTYTLSTKCCLNSQTLSSTFFLCPHLPLLYKLPVTLRS